MFNAKVKVRQIDDWKQVGHNIGTDEEWWEEPEMVAYYHANPLRRWFMYLRYPKVHPWVKFWWNTWLLYKEELAKRRGEQ